MAKLPSMNSSTENPPTMTIEEALRSLGANAELLSAEERHQLDTDGFLMLPNVLSAEQLAEFRRRIDLLTELEGSDGGREVHQEAGTARLSNLVDKGEIFRLPLNHPKLLAAISHVLRGNFKLSSLNARAALPGQGLQALHADWGGPVAPGDYAVCNSIWLLDDFTPHNGATRAVPGSHRSGKVPKDDMQDPQAPHPDEMLLLGEAGSVFVFNSHTWHGGTCNHTKLPRRAMHAYFCRRDQPQQTPQQELLSRATIRRLSPEERCILDVMLD